MSDSSLGECFKSLANVQSPSWSHAYLGHTHQWERALTAVVFFRSIPRWTVVSHSLFNPAPPEAKLVCDLSGPIHT